MVIRQMLLQINNLKQSYKKDKFRENECDRPSPDMRDVSLIQTLACYCEYQYFI